MKRRSNKHSQEAIATNWERMAVKLARIGIVHRRKLPRSLEHVLWIFVNRARLDADRVRTGKFPIYRALLIMGNTRRLQNEAVQLTKSCSSGTPC